MRLARIVAGLAFVVAAVAAPSWGQSGSPPRAIGIFQEGQRAPALELPTLDGRSTIQLDSLTGRKAILLQFASW
jgi:hypothetical protein